LKKVGRGTGRTQEPQPFFIQRFSKNLHLNVYTFFLKKKLFNKISIFCLGSGLFFPGPGTNLFLKKTLRIEVVNGKKNICYCIFGVCLVTGTKNLDISQKETFRISIFFISPL
jgi:hypothetical protein